MPWSAWHDGYDQSFLVPIQNHSLRTGSASDADADAARDLIESGGGDLDTAHTVDGVTSILLVVGESGIANVSLGYRAVTLLGSGYVDSLTDEESDFFDALSLGVDYASIPVDQVGPNTVGDYLDFESADTTFAGWTDFELSSVYLRTYFNGLVPPSTFPLTFWAGAAISPTSSGLYDLGDWQGYQDGVPLLDLDVDISDMVTPNTYYDHVADPATLSMGDVTGADISIVVQPRYLDPATAMPSAPDGSNLLAQFYFDGSSFAQRLQLPLLLGGVSVRYTTPRWRYWSLEEPPPEEPPPLPVLDTTGPTTRVRFF